MAIILSHKNHHFSLHFLPAAFQFRRFENKITWSSAKVTMSPSSDCGREPFQYTRENSYDSTIHSRRTISRSLSSRTPPPPDLTGFADFFHSRVATPVSVPSSTESDAACWERMLMLQREYHCYRSARLEAAVEAMELGAAIEDVPMRETPGGELRASGILT